MSYLTYCTCGSSTPNIAEISKSWFLIHYLAAWINGCSRFRGRTKGILFICWLIINKLQPNVRSWNTCLGPEGVPWIEVPLYDGRIVCLWFFCWILILLNRLLQQLPKPDMIKTVNSWAKLIFPQLVSTAPKVRTVRLWIGILWVRFLYFTFHDIGKDKLCLSFTWVSFKQNVNFQ